MINDGINNVPDKTIAIFTDDSGPMPTKESISNMIKKSPKKRDWFTPHFYRCLPLSIGNQYGFTVSSEFDIEFVWNGGDDPQDVSFTFFDEQEKLSILYPRIESAFGHGIVTIATSFALRTPPGVNLITINPPNFIIPNVTVMTGVVETDNLRRNFNFSIKIQMPNIVTRIPKGYPIAAFMPIPRYFGDKFNLKFAEDIFSDEIIVEENQAAQDALANRDVEALLPSGVGRLYLTGTDVYGNKFKDHQQY